MIWRPNKILPLHHCPFCDVNMTKVCECTTLMFHEFNNNNIYNRPYEDSDDFLHHIEYFSVDAGNNMK